MAKKNGKIPGIDSLQEELLKADTTTASLVFANKIWNHQEIPKDWGMGLIFKIPKKGDRRNCDDWRGITLPFPAREWTEKAEVA